MNPPPAIIEMTGVSVTAMRDDTLTVVEAVDWRVLAGDFWVVGGQAYSGKSDLLMVAAGLMPPARGGCRRFGGGAVDAEHWEERRRIGLVFQGGQLFNQLTVAENVALPLRYQKNLGAAAVAEEVARLLEFLELSEYADLTPSNVAAHWRGRTALARALVLRPEAILLDNPLSALGGRHRRWWLGFLEQLWQGHPCMDNRPLTVVATTDDFRPWQAPARKFAWLHEKTFRAPGGWPELSAGAHPALRELLADAAEPPA